MRRMVIMQTGRAMKNQIPQPGCGDIFWSAIRFCGEAIGDAAPPMLDESAMPRRSAFVMSLSAGRLRRMGWMLISIIPTVAQKRHHTWIILKQSTGAATLLIHILANIATPILVSNTVLGLVPALLRTNVAIILAMLYFDNAAAIVKPPRSNMMTGVHMAEKM